MKMIETWRWYGPSDPVSLWDIRQAGATGIVNALHEIPIGEVWPLDKLIERKRIIEWDDSIHPPRATGLEWLVVESVPVHESIKLGNVGRDKYIENYKHTLRNLGTIGIKTVVYNFMPVVDWTRTNLDMELEDGAKALSFDIEEFVAFDVFILERIDAPNDYTLDLVKRARAKFDKMTEEQRQTLQHNIIAGLPGAQEGYSLEEFKNKLSDYDGMTNEQYFLNLKYFLEQVIPVAEENGIKMAIHPDDPPRSLFGLPRIAGTFEDFVRIISAVDSASNGFTLCTGSLGVSARNNLTEFVDKLGHRLYFAHLRSVQRLSDGSFYEAGHLKGDVDMYGVVNAILKEQKRRNALHQRDYRIPMRADHGHVILDDQKKITNPGYSAIGLLKGMAELRGLELGILKGNTQDI
jgi:mannonate dehydratase